MAKLTVKARKEVPAKEFGEPGERAYPMPDKAMLRMQRLAPLRWSRKASYLDRKERRLTRSQQNLGDTQSERKGLSRYRNRAGRGYQRHRYFSWASCRTARYLSIKSVGIKVTTEWSDAQRKSFS